MFRRFDPPWYLPVLRNALCPVHDNLDKRILPEYDSPRRRESNIVGLVIDHLDRISADVMRLNSDLNRLGYAVADANADSGEADILRAVARLQERLDRILRNRDEAELLEVSGEDDSDAHEHLTMVYFHTLDEIREGLRGWLDFLDNPEPTSGKPQRGVQVSRNAIELTLKLSPPYAQIEELLEWLKRRALSGHAPYDPTMAFVESYKFANYDPPGLNDDIQHEIRTQNRDGCLPVLVGLALGWMIGSG